MFLILLASAFGDYATKMGNDIITSRSASSVSGNPTMLDWRGRRVLYTDEADRGSHINSGVIKDFTGGGIQRARLLFSNAIKGFEPQWHLLGNFNKPPDLPGDDTGLQRRVRNVRFISIFDEAFIDNEDPGLHFYAADPSVDKEMVRLGPTFMRILLDKYEHDYTYTCPQTILDDSKELMESSNHFATFAKMFLVKSESQEDFFTIKKARERFRFGLTMHNTDLYHVVPKVPNEQEFRDNLPRILRAPVFPRKMIDGVRLFSVVNGWRLRSVEDVLNDDPDA